MTRSNESVPAPFAEGIWTDTDPVNIVGHGAPLASGGRQAFAKAYEWLPANDG